MVLAGIECSQKSLIFANGIPAQERVDFSTRSKDGDAVLLYPPVAQLDNAADSDSEERGFESLRAGQTCATIKHKSPKPLRNQGFFAVLRAIFKR